MNAKSPEVAVTSLYITRDSSHLARWHRQFDLWSEQTDTRQLNAYLDHAQSALTTLDIKFFSPSFALCESASSLSVVLHTAKPVVCAVCMMSYAFDFECPKISQSTSHTYSRVFIGCSQPQLNKSASHKKRKKQNTKITYVIEQENVVWLVRCLIQIFLRGRLDRRPFLQDCTPPASSSFGSSQLHFRDMSRDNSGVGPPRLLNRWDAPSKSQRCGECRKGTISLQGESLGTEEEQCQGCEKNGKLT